MTFPVSQDDGRALGLTHRRRGSRQAAPLRVGHTDGGHPVVAEEPAAHGVTQGQPVNHLAERGGIVHAERLLVTVGARRAQPRGCGQEETATNRRPVAGTVASQRRPGCVRVAGAMVRLIGHDDVERAIAEHRGLEDPA